jgi:hypothetical protein
MKKIGMVVMIFALLALPGAYAVAAPVLDAGWAYDQITEAFEASVYSPYDFTVTDPTQFSLTDAYIAGDTYIYTDFGAFIGATSFTTYSAFSPSLATADAAWANPDYKHGQWLLDPGTYKLVVMGDGIGGFPAGFFARLDTVSVPEASMMLLFGSGLFGLVAFRRAKRMM